MSNVYAFVIDHVSTAIGTMLVVSDTTGALRALDWEDHAERMRRLLGRHYGREGFTLAEGRAPESIRGPLERYFAGELDAVASIPVATGGTTFQREVWSALRGIPVGETLSYGALAASIGRPSAVRAVGHANGANPIGVVVPCHRVIGANASLTGYAGGIERKRWLLTHERASA
jgi:methylated-DNA-[protein]-cysteine S-methyltransferase